MDDCKYCNGECNSFGDSFYIYIGDHGRSVIINTTYSSEYNDVEADIAFCPMCGRKLG